MSDESTGNKDAQQSAEIFPAHVFGAKLKKARENLERKKAMYGKSWDETTRALVRGYELLLEMAVVQNRLIRLQCACATQEETPELASKRRQLLITYLDAWPRFLDEVNATTL